MKVIKFTLSSPFAFFKNKENINVNYSFPFITKTSVIGGLAAIIGLKGFKDYSKNYSNIYSQIEDFEKEISKLNIDSYKNNILKSIDKLIESNNKKNLIEQNNLLLDFKNKVINDIFLTSKACSLYVDVNEKIVLNKTLKNHLKKHKEAQDEIISSNKEIKNLKSKVELLDIEYRVLFDNKISIVPKKEVNYVNVTFNDSTRIGISENKKCDVVNITEHVLTDVEYDIYYELKDNELDKKIEEYLLNNKSVYDFYLGKNQFVANISEVEILELSNINDNDIENIEFESLIDIDLINNRDFNGIKINMPIKNSNNGIYSDYKMLISGKYNINKNNKDLYSFNNKGLYFI